MLPRCLRALSVKSCKHIITVSSYSSFIKNNVIFSPYKDVELSKLTIPEYIWKDLDKWPDHTAAVCGVTGRRYTYAQLRKLCSTFATNLRRRLHLKDGDCVAIFMPNIPEFPVAVLGSLEAGCCVTTINHLYTSYEIRKQLVLSDAKVVITIEALFKVVKEAISEIQRNIPVITINTTEETSTPDSAINFKDLANEVNVDTSVLKEVSRTFEDIAAIPYSSGTTGMPKGVELTHHNLVSNCQQMDGEEIKHPKETTATHQDAVMTVLPLFHIYGFNILMLNKLANGCKMVTLPKFDLKHFLNAIVEHKTSLLYAAPPMILALASHAAVKPEHMEPLRMVMCAAAPVPEADVMKLLNRFKKGMEFLQGWGMTESSPLATMMRNGEVNYTSVGYPVPNSQLKVVDDKGNALGPNQVKLIAREEGEILIRGPNIMKRYRNNPEATRDTITEDGWLKTGDLGSYDANGAVFIADRLKELIKVKGFQVPPAELESVIREHPGVLDAVVIGVKNERTGEAPKAFVVAQPNSKVQQQDIMNYVAKRVAPYKKLIAVQFIDTVPKSASGKILRKDVKAMYGD